MQYELKTGKKEIIYDKEAGLYYLRASTITHTQEDICQKTATGGEEENPASLNLYTYCFNDLVNNIDPSGHWQQGDEKLSVYAQRRLKRLTDEYYGAENKAQRDAIHRKAEAIRNNRNYYYGGDRKVDNFARTANSSIRNSSHVYSKRNKYVTAETWKKNGVRHNRRTGGNAQYTNNSDFFTGNRWNTRLSETINIKVEKEANTYSDYKISNENNVLDIINNVDKGNYTKEYQQEQNQINQEKKTGYNSTLNTKDQIANDIIKISKDKKLFNQDSMDEQLKSVLEESESYLQEYYNDSKNNQWYLTKTYDYSGTLSWHYTTTNIELKKSENMVNAYKGMAKGFFLTGPQEFAEGLGTVIKNYPKQVKKFAEDPVGFTRIYII